VDAEEESEPQSETQSGERSPKRPRVEAEPTVEAESEPSGVTMAAAGSETVSQGEVEEEVLVDGAVAMPTVRSPSTSRIPRPVGNPVASSSSSEVDT